MKSLALMMAKRLSLSICSSRSRLISFGDVILINTASAAGSLTITLPVISTSTLGRKYTIVDSGGQANTKPIDVTRSGSDLVLGTTFYRINGSYGSVTLLAIKIGQWAAI